MPQLQPGLSRRSNSSRRNQTCLGEATAKTDEGGSKDGSVLGTNNPLRYRFVSKVRTDPFPFLNQFAVRKSLEPRRQELETLLASLK